MSLGLGCLENFLDPWDCVVKFQPVDIFAVVLLLGRRLHVVYLPVPVYRLWSIHDQHPAMQRVVSGGAALSLEIWAVPMAHLGTILLGEPAGLCIGKVLLADDSAIRGVLGEAWLCEGQREITASGGWREYSKQSHGV
jgi:hypothetical protein